MKRSIISCLLLLLLAPFGANAFKITPRKTAADAAKRSPGAQPTQKADSAAVDTTDASEEFDPYVILNQDEDPWTFDQFEQDGGTTGEDDDDSNKDKDNGGERDNRNDQGERGE
jgi:hypothetical protein